MAGETYSQRYAGGFKNRPDVSTPADAAFLNAVETALRRLLGEDPAADEVGVWVPGSDRFEFKKITNANVDAAAAIDYSKINVPAGAILKSKLAALGITNADIDAAAAIAISKLAGYPGSAAAVLKGNGAWGAVPYSGARVYHNVNVSVAHNTLTTLAFNSEAWDTDGYHDNVTNNSRLTIPETGYYRVTAHVSWQASSAGMREVRFVRSDGVIFGLEEQSPGASGFVVQDVSAEYHFNAGMYVQIQAYQNSGGALDCQRAASYGYEASISKIGV